MQYAIIIAPTHIDDVAKREQLIQEVRHTRGVLTLDLEIAENGLLLADISNPEVVAEVAKLDGVSSVEGMGVKHALNPPA